MMVTLTSFTLAAFLVPMKRGLISGSTYRILKAELQRLNQKWRNISLLHCSNNHSDESKFRSHRFNFRSNRRKAAFSYVKLISEE